MEKRGATHIEVHTGICLICQLHSFRDLYLQSCEYNKTFWFVSALCCQLKWWKNASVDVTTYSVKINKNKVRQTSRQIAASILNIPQNEKIRVENYSGQVLNSERSNDGTAVYFDYGGNDFVLIKFSEDIDQTGQVAKSQLSILHGMRSPPVQKTGSYLKKGFLSWTTHFTGLVRGSKNTFKIPASVNFEVLAYFADGSDIRLERKTACRDWSISDSSRREVLRIMENLSLQILW